MHCSSRLRCRSKTLYLETVGLGGAKIERFQKSGLEEGCYSGPAHFQVENVAFGDAEGLPW
jgi:hypothetical protein